MIVKENGKYHVKSEDGSKNLGGPYASKEQAEKRLKVVEYFKNAGKFKAEHGKNPSWGPKKH